MTYAGLKSMIYAGLTADDPRVKAAYDYITKHYTLDENPGLGQQGLYYYYQTFAKALAAARQADPRRRRGQGRTTGGPSWSPPWPSARTPTGAGSTRPTASWKATRTSSPPTACSPWPTPGPRGKADSLPDILTRASSGGPDDVSVRAAKPQGGWVSDGPAEPQSRDRRLSSPRDPDAHHGWLGRTLLVPGAKRQEARDRCMSTGSDPSRPTTACGCAARTSKLSGPPRRLRMTGFGGDA